MSISPIKTIDDECAVPLGWDKTRLDMGIRDRIMWHPARASPHLLVSGQSGAGKTKFLELFSSKCVQNLPNCQLYLADPKCIDFEFAKGSARFWSGMDSGEALRAFHSSMMARVNGEGCSSNWKVLIFDEVAAFSLLQTDKKRRAEFQDMMASTLLLGRGVRHVLVVGVQKSLMEFLTSSRSQYATIVLMGNISNDKEQVQMLMSTHKDVIQSTHNGRGQFWVTSDGAGVRRGQVPWITDITKVHSLIVEGLNRT